VIPGLWFLIAAFPAFTIFVQQDEPNALQAIRSAVNLSRGQWWRLFLLWLAGNVLLFLGSLVFGIGAILVTPLVATAFLLITAAGTEETKTHPFYGSGFAQHLPPSKLLVNP
jgi:uncharacterized membrane protein